MFKDLEHFQKKFGIPVFVNQKTLDAMPKQKEKISEKISTSSKSKKKNLK